MQTWPWDGTVWPWDGTVLQIRFHCCRWAYFVFCAACEALGTVGRVSCLGFTVVSDVLRCVEWRRGRLLRSMIP